MASREPEVHRLGLGRIVVDGNRQPIVRVATLTLKDEDPDKHIMQVHVDGSTLVSEEVLDIKCPRLTNSQAQWDLGTLKERKSTGGEQFLSISEQNMLQFTLPSSETDGQTIAHRAELKTIQLFILKPQHFHTAVNYLSQNARMRHCHLKNVSANLMDANAPRNAQSRPREPSTTSTMKPPMGPAMGPRVRPLSQASVFGPVRLSPAQFIGRPQTARPNSMFLNGDSTQQPPKPGSTVPVPVRMPQGHRYQPIQRPGPQDPRGVLTPDAASQRQRFPSRGPGVGGVGVGDTTPMYGQPVRRDSMASHVPLSRSMQHNRQESPTLNHQIETGTDHVSVGPCHGSLDGQFADQAGSASSSARRTISMRTSPFAEHTSTRLPPERPAYRSPSISEHGVPVNIQVLGPPDEPSYSEPSPKIRWKFTLHLLPSTKMWELCLHAASYVRREYDFTMDGRALAVQSSGAVFKNQDSLSKAMLQGEPLILIERRHMGTAHRVPANFDRSFMDPLHLDCTSQADNSVSSERRLVGRAQTFPANFDRSSMDPLYLGWTSQDEADQVPPPRQLPFPLVAATAPSRSSSAIVATQFPLSERPNLINTGVRTRASEQIEKAISQNISTKRATRKQPGSRQKRPPSASKRPASSVGRSKLDSMSVTIQPPEPRTLRKRPATSLGIQRKRKASSSNEGVSAALPSVIESVPSDAQVSKQEMAQTPCMGCRRKKRKCNRLKPSCDQCLKDTRTCIYPNNEETSATGSIADQAHKGDGLEIVNHPMVLGSQALISLPVMSDASTQTSLSKESRDIATQTQAAEPDRIEVDMKDVGTDPCNLYTDASVETEGCDDIWLPFSQATEVVVWACRRSEEQRPKAVEIFKITDPSHEDYASQLEQAAVYAARFKKELREKCEEVLRR